MSKQPTFEVIDYDTDYLDAIEGGVTDTHTTALATIPATDHAAITRQSRGNLVLPTPTQAPAQGQKPIVAALGQLLAPQSTDGQQDAYAIQHMQSMSEHSTPMERNRSKITLFAAWVAVAGIVALGLHKAELIDNRMAWLCFVAAFAYGVYKSNADENAHSPAGVERHKTDVYGQIQIAKLTTADKANARAHETFGKVVDKVYGGSSDVQNRITHKR